MGLPKAGNGIQNEIVCWAE